MRPLHRSLPWLVAGASGLGLVAGIAALRSELDGLRREQRVAVERRTEIEARIAGFDTLVERAVEARLAPLAEQARAEREALEAALAEREALIRELAETRDSGATAGLESRIAAIDAALGQRFEAVESRLDVALHSVDEGRSALEALATRLPRDTDPESLWAEFVAPIAQVNGEFTVGSAVVLRSQPAPGGMRTPVLTAWHVVRDVQEDPSEPSTPVPIRIFRDGLPPRDETARVLAWNVERDIALLELETLEGVEHGARLASPDRLQRLSTFDTVYAVGCPLGTEPVPTFGSVASSDHVVDDRRYLMTNAPTYIGNSGGGIFDAESGELVAVFSKIYNHGNLRPTIVPHMGLSVPLDEVYTWLDGEGYAIEPGPTGDLTIVEKTPDQFVAEAR